MTDYIFTWTITRASAKQLLRKQLLEHPPLKAYFFYSVLSVCAAWFLFSFDVNMYCILLSCFLFIYVILIIYLLYYFSMCPPRGFKANYKAEFKDHCFIISGRVYIRTCTYSQIQRIYSKNNALYILTPYEGVIIPYSAFVSKAQEKEFWDFLNKKLF